MDQGSSVIVRVVIVRVRVRGQGQEDKDEYSRVIVRGLGYGHC